MKEDIKKSLDNCEAEKTLIEFEESHNNEKEKKNELVEPAELDDDVENSDVEPSVNNITTIESSGTGKAQIMAADDGIKSEEGTKLAEPVIKEHANINGNSGRLEESGNLCQIKLVLRPRKTDIIENGEEESKLKNFKNGCRKTEKKCAIKKEEDLAGVTPVVCNNSSNSILEPSLVPVTTQSVNDGMGVLTVNSMPKLEPVDDNASLADPPKIIEDESTELLQFIKSADDDSSKSKDNSESDTKVSSSASDNSILRSTKKRRRKRDIWWTKKRKRSENNHAKTSANINATNAFSWTETNSSNTSLDENIVNNKRKGSERPEGNSKKPKEFAIPSPSLADINIKAATPESTATSAKVTRNHLCLCRKKPNVFISGNNNTGDLYCQALDCIDNRIVGCCNAIPSQDVGLYRASQKSPYQMMCSVHQERLMRHNCCPGCGLFCTQGKYLMCKSWHHFHRTCFSNNNKGTSISCPHCGDTQSKPVIVSLHASKDPVFLPIQKPLRNMKSAKMSIARGNVQMVEEAKDPTFDFSSSIFNCDGKDGSPQNGVTQILQRDKLAHLLNIACRSFSKICCNNRYSYKILFTAAQNGEVEKLLKVIASGLNPNHVFEENNNRTALHVAAGNGHLPVVHILLQAKVEINVFDGEQNTPLTAAISAKHNDVVKYLIKCGADLALKGEDGMGPLHIAAKSGNVEACFHLLNGTHLPPKYIDSLDDGGWTAMVWASEFNHLEVVRFLISRGADSLIKDAEQNIALHWAAFGGSIDIVEMFLNDGSDINAVNVHGDTPLHIAARQNKYNCVLLLLARGARSDIKNKNGELPRDCSDSPSSDIYKGITLNMEISALLTRFQNRSPRIISNDISRGKERNQIQCVNSVDDEGEPEDFVYVSESCFTSKITVDRTINSLQSCKCRDVCSSDGCNCAGISVKCWYDNDGRLKPDFNYVDPPLIFECNQACHCNRITCRNRVVQNGITCRFQLFRTEGRGWGIRTLNLIPKGTFVCEYVGEIISDWEADHREDDSYLFDLENRDGETYCIDARYYGNIARFINHMCVPNVMPVHIFVDHQDLRFPRIAFFANRDIQPNEELGYNYGDKFWVIKWKSFTCVCGSEKCLYSENTIKTTLDNYQKKLSEENP